MSSYEKDKQKIQQRLRRIEGQLRGIQKMIDEDKYCIDILTQLSSVIAATQKVGLVVLQDHINGCLKDALINKDGQVKIDEMIKVVDRFIKA